jgi:cell division protease FtsH
MGARTPKGVILYGPPGTGKTLLAKAVAGEAKVPFFQVSGSAFDDMLVGVGAKRVRDLFSKARKVSPAIIFIDEIDSVASKRGKFDMSGGGGVADQTINQLLAEMDGFSTKTGIVVMAATNRLDVLDDAILRPGRFDRHIQVNLPDIKEREAILKIHAKNKNVSTSVSLADIARRTPGMSGAQLENVLNEATLLAVRFKKTAIGVTEIDEAIDRVVAGPAKKSRVISVDEKKQIAIHEAGHALVGLYTPGADKVEKITIIPRGRAAGYTISNPEKQEITIQKKSDLIGMVTELVGARAAEEIKLGAENVSTGASNDLYRASNIVRSMVMQLGMTNAGLTQFIPSEGTVNPYQAKLYSEQTAQNIDREIENIMQECYAKAKVIINANEKELDLIVETLLVLETIVKEQIDYIHAEQQLPPEVISRREELEKAKQETEKAKDTEKTQSPKETKTFKKAKTERKIEEQEQNREDADKNASTEN